MAKLGVTAVPPVEFVALRFVVASAVLLAMAGITRTALRGPLGMVVAVACTGFFGYHAAVFVGLTLAPASDAALIVPTTVPIFTAVGATFVGERFDTRRRAGLAAASLGAAIVVVSAQQGMDFDTRRLAGDLLLLAGALCWAAYTTIASVGLRSISPLAIVALATPIGGLMLLPLGLLERGYADVPTWSGGVWLALLYLAVFVSVGGFILHLWIVGRVGPGLASLGSYLVPIATLLLAALILGERPHPLQLVGGAIILAGVRIVTASRDIASEAVIAT
ncbi:MAG: DMT family transporter [Chloroflexi bacterium]|nr:DMT family transporter [Chloroflexota bacterium]